MSEIAYPTVPSSPDHWHRYPQPWEQMSPAADWTFDARERRPPNVNSAAAQTATADLIHTLTERPDVFWPIWSAEKQLRDAFGLSAATALTLLRDCPGAAVPEVGVWCSSAAAPRWAETKARVQAAVGDVLMTYDEVVQAVAGIDPVSTFAALAVLCRDEQVACVQNSAAEPQYFVRARPGANANYDDLLRARLGAPQPAA